MSDCADKSRLNIHLKFLPFAFFKSHGNSPHTVHLCLRVDSEQPTTAQSDLRSKKVGRVMTTSQFKELERRRHTAFTHFLLFLAILEIKLRISYRCRAHFEQQARQREWKLRTTRKLKREPNDAKVQRTHSPLGQQLLRTKSLTVRNVAKAFFVAREGKSVE